MKYNMAKRVTYLGETSAVLSVSGTRVRFSLDLELARNGLSWTLPQTRNQFQWSPSNESFINVPRQHYYWCTIQQVNGHIKSTKLQGQEEYENNS